MVAVSDMVNGGSQVLVGQKLNIAPSTSGQEWVIHNVYVPLGSVCQIYRYIDGTNDILLHTLSYSVGNLDYHCKISSYIYLKNAGSSSAYFGYDGMISKV